MYNTGAYTAGYTAHPPAAAAYGGPAGPAFGAGQGMVMMQQQHPQQGMVMMQQQQPQQGMVMMQQQQQRFNPYVQSYVPANPTAFALFSNVDTDKSGNISVKELHNALSHGGWTTFSRKTTRLLVSMFDANKTGSAGALDYPEFERLITQLNNWRSWFDSADRDRSGKLNFAETTTSIKQFGFNLPDNIMHLVFNAYDEDVSGTIGFDEFVQLLAELNALTSMFRRFDSTGSGVATLDYNSFMSIVFATRS